MTTSFPTRRSSDLEIGFGGRGAIGLRLAAGIVRGEVAGILHGEAVEVDRRIARHDLDHRSTREDGLHRLDERMHRRLVETLPFLSLGLLGQCRRTRFPRRSEEHTSELQSLMRISYAVFCLKKKHSNTH